VNVRAAGHEGRGHRATNQHGVVVEHLPVALELIIKALAAQHRPGFLERHQLHPLENVVRHAGAAVRKSFALPLRCQVDQLVLRDLLRTDGLRDQHQACDRQHAETIHYDAPVQYLK
jgi:hypothetical protein